MDITAISSGKRVAAAKGLALVVILAWASAGIKAQTPVTAPLPHYTVAQDGTGDFNGDTEEPILAAIDAARKGGAVFIKRGVYTIWHTIVLDGATNLTLKGEKGTILRLPPLPQTSVTETAPKGSRQVKAADAAVFRSHTKVRFKAPGRTDIHHGKPVVIPTFDVTVAELRDGVMVLSEALKYPVPAGTPVAFAENLVSIRSGANVTLEGLVLDGNKHRTDPDFVGHVTLCPFLASGPYDYDKGLAGEPIRGLTLLNCTFRNTRGRCIAWYAVVESAIIGCLCEDTPDAGIDIDHFCSDLTIRDNTIRHCGIGVEINDGSWCDVRGNMIEHCLRGVAIWRWCKHDYLNVENTIAGNTIKNSGKAAIHFQANTARNQAIDNHLIGGAGDGIIVEGDQCVIRGNHIEGFAGQSIRVVGKGNTVTRQKGDSCPLAKVGASE
jgi:parallel beta helix pectate lyase-like protein